MQTLDGPGFAEQEVHASTIGFSTLAWRFAAKRSLDVFQPSLVLVVVFVLRGSWGGIAHHPEAFHKFRALQFCFQAQESFFFFFGEDDLDFLEPLLSVLRQVTLVDFIPFVKVESLATSRRCARCPWEHRQDQPDDHGTANVGCGERHFTKR